MCVEAAARNGEQDPLRHPRYAHRLFAWKALRVNRTADHRLKLYEERVETSHDVGSDTIAAGEASRPTVVDLERELERTRRALRRCEAELAAGVPLVPQPQPQRHLAERLEAVLKGIAEALGCSAAAVYLLDAATTELKLRTAWNLPFERFLESARSLPGAVADIEALAGHAVVLEDVTHYGAWNLPNVAGRSAVCVPVSSPSVPLGTLWLFAAEPRTFSDQEVNLVEIGAGRIASDLEREMLMTETRDAARLRRAWDDAEYRRSARTPQTAPLCDGWEIAGRTLSVDGGPAEFYDWRMSDDDVPAAAVGAVEQTQFAAALEIETLRTLWRAHARHQRDAGRLLELINDDLWGGSTETAAANLLVLRAAGDGAVTLAAAGRPQAALLGPQKAERIPLAAAPLGIDPEARYTTTTVRPAAGEVVVASDDDRLLERLVADWVSASSQQPAPVTAARWLDRLVGLLGDDQPHGTLVVLRRKS